MKSRLLIACAVAPVAIVAVFAAQGSGGAVVPREVQAAAVTKALPHWRIVVQHSVLPGGLDVLIDGQPVRPLTRPAKGSEEEDSQPTWSPDGHRVAFARSYGDRPGLYVVGVADRRSRPVSTGWDDDSELDWAAITWSPDGQRIAFLRDDAVFVVGSNGGSARLVLPGLTWGCQAPSWSPDGGQLVAACSGRLWIANADGSGRHAVSGERDAFGGASWSPDGRSIAYGRRCYTPDVHGGDVFCDVAVIRPAGGGRRTLVRRDGTGPTDWPSTWSSTGELLVTLWGYKDGIVAVNPSTGRTRKLYQTTGWNLTAGPNGTFAVQVEPAYRKVYLDIFNRDGKRLLRVPGSYDPTLVQSDVWLGPR